MCAYDKSKKGNKILPLLAILAATLFFVAVVVFFVFQLFARKSPLAEYEILDSNPTSEQIEKTIDQLQKRAKSLGASISVTLQGEKMLSVKGEEHALTKDELTALTSSGELQFILYSDLKTVQGENPNEGDKVVYDKSKVLMTGDMIDEAEAKKRQMEGVEKTDYGVSIKFSDKGAEEFAKLTGEHVGEQLAIVFDEKLVSAPNLMEEITGGECWISGSFTDESARQLAAILCTGRLALQLKVKKYINQ